jgi:hypothetical protein
MATIAIERQINLVALISDRAGILIGACKVTLRRTECPLQRGYRTNAGKGGMCGSPASEFWASSPAARGALRPMNTTRPPTAVNFNNEIWLEANIGVSLRLALLKTSPAMAKHD